MRKYDREVTAVLRAQLGEPLGAGERIELLELSSALNTSNTRWIAPFISLHQELVKALSKAKKAPAMRGGSRVIPVNYHAQNVFGGALVKAFQNPPSGDSELLSCGYVSREPLVPLVQSYAPRDRMDRSPYLPRRFV